MFGFGKCKHAFKDLRVYKDSTSEPSTGKDSTGVPFSIDYTNVNIHLYCSKCGTGNLAKYGTDGALTIKYAKHKDQL